MSICGRISAGSDCAAAFARLHFFGTNNELRSPPRLSTPTRPSKNRMTCFVLIFNFCETSAGVEYSANEGEILTSEQGASGCRHACILACARSSRVAFNPSRFPGWSDLSSNDLVQCTLLLGVNSMDVAFPGTQRNSRPDASSTRATRAPPRESRNHHGYSD